MCLTPPVRTGELFDLLRDGRPWTRAQLAEATGHPTAIRATATACARNAATLFVPCHRVLRQDGTVAGCRYGTPLKQWLLTSEDGGPPTV